MASMSSAARVRVDPVQHDIIGHKAESLDDLDAAFRNEREVFEASGYGEMPRELDMQSSFYLARSMQTGEVLGSLRMIQGAPLTLPMMKLPLDDEWAERLAEVAPERLSEYGALAIPPHVQSDVGLSVSKALYRAGWEHTVEHDAAWCGMVMEPRRARVMARWHGLVFHQGGPTEYYMGGEVAAFFTTPRVIIEDLERVNPELSSYITSDFDMNTDPPTRILPSPKR